MWFLLPALVFLAKDRLKVKRAVESVPEDRREAAIEAAGSPSELARIVRAAERAETAATETARAYNTLSTIAGYDPAAGVTPTPEPLPMIGSGGAANYLPAGQTTATATQAPDPYLPALVLAGLWWFAKRRK
ncbi:MAG: hypothetical protein PHR30_18670 [Gallionellaceae bacterium]|nr:hypothetical protein [Gallionellaceae bacterium]